jgi:hypothetical protein
LHVNILKCFSLIVCISSWGILSPRHMVRLLYRCKGWKSRNHRQTRCSTVENKCPYKRWSYHTHATSRSNNNGKVRIQNISSKNKLLIILKTKTVVKTHLCSLWLLTQIHQNHHSALCIGTMARATVRIFF